MATRETLASFEGRSNVTAIENNGVTNHLTQSVSFEQETNRVGACKLAVFETEKKHVLFLFNEADEEVGRYYLGKNLQGKGEDKLIEERAHILFFESWNPETGSWVPCAGFSNQESLVSKAKAWR